MNKIKIIFNNFLNNLKVYFNRLYRRSYGMDDVNKFLLYTSLIISLLNFRLGNNVLNSISLILFVIFVFRYFSSNKFARNEENRKIRRFIKYIKLKRQYSKTHKIFMCKDCGQFIRVPKHQGKIETTCPNCGKKEIHHT